jgi:hypothetical protein
MKNHDLPYKFKHLQDYDEHVRIKKAREASQKIRKIIKDAIRDTMLKDYEGYLNGENSLGDWLFKPIEPED